MSIEKLSGTIIEGYDGSGYKQYDKLTAGEFNKLPRKINELVTYVNNISAIDDIDLEELATINDRVNDNSYNISYLESTLNNTIDEMHSLPTVISPDNISDAAITNIDNYSEIRLGLNEFGQICLLKNDDMSVNIDVSPSSFEIDQVIDAPIAITITILQGQDRVRTIEVTSNTGTTTQLDDMYHWQLTGITTDADITVTINNRRPRSVRLPFSMIRSGYIWSPTKLYAANFRRPQMEENKGFYTPNGMITSIDSSQNYWRATHPDKRTPMYFHIITTTKVEVEDLRTKFFLYGSSISGGMDYVGEVTQYSTNIPYYIYRSNDKIDTSISVQIQ